MPVLKIYFSRFQKMTGLSRESIVERLPFLGLDIEGEDAESIRIEYNPNRPDFSTDYGIARALLGLVGKSLGLPEYTVKKGSATVEVSRNLSKVRPYISCAIARGLRMDDETIRQLISMQEDLHNGLARKRKKSAIGLHDLNVIRSPFSYAGVPSSFEFVPLGATTKMSVESILLETETGQRYGSVLKGADVYPILRDARGTVLSFPPIINGNATKVGISTKNLFVDVTSTERRVGDDVLAIISAALSDAGATIESVQIDYPDSRSVTPDMSPRKMAFDGKVVERILGLELGRTRIAECLERSRLSLDKEGNALIPSYRTDILHPVDLAEEVVIGYGLDKIEGRYPSSSGPGNFSPLAVFLDKISESVAMAGFIETMNFDLVDMLSLYTKFARSPDSCIEVENPRTIEHSVLRDSAIPSLMDVLSRNVQASYPQRLYDVGRVFLRDGTKILERPVLCALTAHSSASFSEAKTYLEALVSTHLGDHIETRPAAHWAFAEGRSAEVFVKGKRTGFLGEIASGAVAAFGLEVPVAGYEVDLQTLLQNSL